MRRPLEIAWKTAAIAAGAWILNALLFGLLLEGSALTAGQTAPPAEVMLLSLAAALLLTASLVYPALRSVLAGARLAVALFLAVFGLHVALVAVEGLVFLGSVPRADLVLAALCDTLTAALLAFLLARAFGAGTPASATATEPADRHGAGWWIGRIGLCSLCYVVLYFTAGALIWPAIRSFYEAEGLTPDPALVLPLQVVRGALYVLFVLPLLRSLAVRRWQASLAMAAMFPVLAGVAALLVPNPVFPDAVRGCHLIEIGWSNFVYGALVGWLFWNPGGGRLAAESASGRAS